MIRKNIDNRPIYYDSIWHQMLKTGKKLVKLGYIESKGKPNLFFKSFKSGFKSYDGQVQFTKGVMFADLRGNEVIPIWSDPNPNVYGKDLSVEVFFSEFVLLVRSGCLPRVFTIESDPCDPLNVVYDLLSNLDDILDAYCHRCGADLVNKLDWVSLNEAVEGDRTFGVNYCKPCLEIEYSLKKYRELYYIDLLICELCLKVKSTLNHHITYNPEKIVHVCHSCHGKIHSKPFPHALWKEKR
ncbi:hypothetical protein LCGC14_2300370, partial [marine sediment metagenome]